ncbi:putative movement protein [Niminivirus]|nr:putative movement protein [Niminivirus]
MDRQLPARSESTHSSTDTESSLSLESLPVRLLPSPTIMILKPTIGTNACPSAADGDGNGLPRKSTRSSTEARGLRKFCTLI